MGTIFHLRLRVRFMANVLDVYNISESSATKLVLYLLERKISDPGSLSQHEKVFLAAGRL